MNLEPRYYANKNKILYKEVNTIASYINFERKIEKIMERRLWFYNNQLLYPWAYNPSYINPKYL